MIFGTFEGGLGIKGYVISVMSKVNLQYFGCVLLYTYAMKLEQDLWCSLRYSATVENFLNY